MNLDVDLDLISIVKKKISTAKYEHLVSLQRSDINLDLEPLVPRTYQSVMVSFKHPDSLTLW